jgi:hypothetical protein
MASIRLTSTHLNSKADIIGSITGVASVVFQGVPLFRNAIVELLTSLPDIEPKFSNSVGQDSNYVTRPLLEEDIEKVSRKVISEKRGEYTIIVGPKGGGKSSVVARVFGGKKGVIFIKISHLDSSSSFLAKLMATCGKIVEERLPLGVEVLIPVIKEAAKRNGGVPVTVILEVERDSSSQDALASVKCIAKKLAVAANVIVILSEANAGLAFGDDKRQQFIWVDELLSEEAERYARKINPNVSMADLELVFENVGKLPLDIGLSMDALADGSKSAAEIVDWAVGAALDDLNSFPHQQIIAALKAFPDGVRASKFKGVENKGVSLAIPKDVAVAMKKVGAIVYHLPSREYRLATRAHRAAMLLYEL